MKNNNITEIVMILDRSGSMYDLRDDTVGGFNTFIEDQKRLPGKALFSCLLFNHETSLLYDRVPMENVRPMVRSDFRPDGCTALLDAVGAAIDRTVTVQKLLPEELRAGRVVFAIITDGMENSSTHYSIKQVRRMIEKEQRDYGWEFLFLGANIDAIGTAESYGIRPENAVEYCADGDGTRANYEAISMAVGHARACSAPIPTCWKDAVEADHRRKRR